MSLNAETWPDLRLPGWEATEATLHRWIQMVGKTQLALAPMLNHWWQVSMRVTSRGISTPVMYYQGRGLQLEFDFIYHRLEARSSDGRTRFIALTPRSVAQFYEDYLDLLESLDVHVAIWPTPVELMDATPFHEDHEHRSYDPAWANAHWRVLLQADRLLKEFRAKFTGKASPVHFFWGSFDLAVTRFSGRPAPLHPGGVPNCPDWVMQEAYSQEVSSAGFWAGGPMVPEAAFYAYAYPEPPGFSSAWVQPQAARYDSNLHEYVLPYEAVHGSPWPNLLVGDFLQTTYEAAAVLAGWEREKLERHVPASSSGLYEEQPGA